MAETLVGSQRGSGREFRLWNVYRHLLCAWLRRIITRCMCSHGPLPRLLYPRIEKATRRYGASNTPKSNAILRNNSHRPYPQPLLQRHLQNRRSPPTNIQYVFPQYSTSNIRDGRDIELYARLRRPNPSIRAHLLLYSTILFTNVA